MQTNKLNFFEFAFAFATRSPRPDHPLMQLLRKSEVKVCQSRQSKTLAATRSAIGFHFLPGSCGSCHALCLKNSRMNSCLSCIFHAFTISSPKTVPHLILYNIAIDRALFADIMTSSADFLHIFLACHHLFFSLWSIHSFYFCFFASISASFFSFSSVNICDTHFLRRDRVSWQWFSFSNFAALALQ